MFALLFAGCATSGPEAAMEYKTVMIDQRFYGAVPNDEVKALVNQGWRVYRVQGRRFAAMDSFTYYWSLRRPKAVAQ